MSARRATWRARGASSRSRGAAPGPAPSGRAGRRAIARTAPDSAATQAKTSSPSGRSQRGHRVGQQRALAGRGAAAVQPADGDAGRVRAAAAPPRRRRPRAARRPAWTAGASARIRLIAGSAVSSPARSSVAGRPVAERRRRRPRPAARRARRRRPRRRPGRRRAGRSRSPPAPRAGVLAAGGVAAQAHPVRAVRPDDPAVPGDPRPPRVRRRPTRGTSRETVGPAAATAAGVPDRTTRRTDGVTSATAATVSTSTGRRPSAAAWSASHGSVDAGRPGRPRGNGVDRAGDRGRGPTHTA